MSAFQTEARFLVWIALWALACFISIAIVAVSERKIVKNFSAMGNAVHEKTRRMHKEFHKALLAMVRQRFQFY